MLAGKLLLPMHQACQRSSTQEFLSFPMDLATSYCLPIHRDDEICTELGCTTFGVRKFSQQNVNDEKPEHFLWHSFDYQFDTLLSCMKLGKNLLLGLDCHLSSWTSDDDPAQGDYPFRMDTSNSWISPSIDRRCYC